MMKTLRILFLVLLTICTPVRRLLADDFNVTVELARDVAAYTVAIERGSEKYDVSSARLVYQINNPVLGIPAAYFFNVGHDGYAIVAGHKASLPLIGFSVDDTLRVDDMAPAMLWWVESYAEMIAGAQLQHLPPSDAVAKRWQEYEGHTLDASAGKATNWLIDDKWDQGTATNPTYNLYCPVHYHQFCVTGCVATALAQIVHYWQYPNVGRYTKAYYPTYTVDGEDGIRTSAVATTISFNQTHYDYENMPASLYSTNDSVEIKAVAQLMFHIGVAVDADYGVDGTSAVSADVPSAMKRYFKYKNSTQVFRSSFSDNGWIDTLRYSIDHKAPLYFSASSPEGGDIHANGHAFICHGYHPSSTNYFRMNWGWGGSGDGWYNMASIDGLNPPSGGSGRYNFNTRQAVLMGMTPPDDSNRFAGVSVPVDAVLHAAYPNPAAYQVMIPYSLQQNSSAVMQVFDVTGRQMEQRVLVPGEGEVRINVTAYPKGIYLYRVQGGAMRKFVVQ
ncbi:MAG: peptidase C10, Streptopain [bacterium P3]|nr:MAG: peptidase C10, Streptopain [bacterium P3]KWW42377.1 MAG: peptidase C10, Streptopain [bacterium F083]